MDKNGGDVKVTYIETQFVASDAAGFKDLVQRLTGCSGRGAVVRAPAPAVHRPSPVKAADDGQGGMRMRPTGFHGGRAPPPCQLEELINEMADFSDDLFYVVGGGSERRRGPHNGGYNDFPY